MGASILHSSPMQSRRALMPGESQRAGMLWKASDGEEGLTESCRMEGRVLHRS